MWSLKRDGAGTADPRRGRRSILDDGAYGASFSRQAFSFA
jgi:hypothetical protein